MRAVTRNRLMNNLYLMTFLVAFSSVALGSLLPCPAHTVDAESKTSGTDCEQRKKERETKQLH